MEIQAAVTHINNTPVAIVWVSRYAISNPIQADAFINELRQGLFDIPVVLVSNHQNQTLYYGWHDDLLQSLAHVPLMKLPWARYEIQ